MNHLSGDFHSLINGLISLINNPTSLCYSIKCICMVYVASLRFHRNVLPFLPSSVYHVQNMYVHAWTLDIGIGSAFLLVCHKQDLTSDRTALASYTSYGFKYFH